jgi:diguanylate cyclase (GGDEF)-like protein/PAS domain S-box-containing protein
MNLDKHTTANAFMTMEIFKAALENADSPNKLGHALTHQLRDLVGGKAVVLIQFTEEISQGFEVVGISPERKTDWTKDLLFIEFVMSHRFDQVSTIIVTDDTSHEYHTLLSTWQVNNIGLVPIIYNESTMGFIVFWDLHEVFRIHGVISTLDSASRFIGTVLKNSQFYKNQENIISIRTQELRQKADDITLLLDSTAEGIYGIDLEGNCTFINKSGLSYLGYASQKNLIGKNMHQLTHVDCQTDSPFAIERCEVHEAFRNNKNIHVEEIKFRREDGTTFFAEAFFHIQFREGVKVGAVITFFDITQRKKELQELVMAKELAETANNRLEASNEELIELNRELAALNEELITSYEEIKLQDSQINDLIYKDALTHLSNRYAISEIIDRSIESNSLKTPMAVLFLDIDNFKLINDIHGHKIGDLVIQETGSRLKSCIDKHIMVGRFGGDEFLVFVNRIQTHEDVDSLLEGIKMSFEHPIYVEGNKFYLTISIGVAFYPEHGITREDLIKKADQALYSAKDSGKNKAVKFNHNMTSGLEAKTKLQHHIKSGFENREFYLNFQPYYEAITKEISGFEALIRWNSPSLGFVSPYELIVNAEEMGLIVDIGAWVFKEACFFARRINQLSSRPLTVSINVSAVQLMDNNFVDSILEIINEVGISPRLLCLEMTETILINSLEQGTNIVMRLKNIGFSIALDDFGTGYSSLKYFKELPVSILKIDKAFISNLKESTYDNDLVHSMLIIAHNRNVSVTAEGVETEEQYQMLLEHRCDTIQGFLFSEPLSEATALELII